MINGFDAKATCGGSAVKVDNSNIKLVKGDKGDRGEAGYTPYIGSNGNWWINGEDTGYKAKGDKGDTYSITESDYQAIADRVPQPDLSDYVKNTDYATTTKGGIVMGGGGYGANTDRSNGRLFADEYTAEQYATRPKGTFIGKGTLENVLNERMKEPQFELIEDITLTEDTHNVIVEFEHNYNRIYFEIIGERNVSSITDGTNLLASCGDELVVQFNNVIRANTPFYASGHIENCGIYRCYGFSSNSKWTLAGATSFISNNLTELPSLSFKPEKHTVNMPIGTTIKVYGIRG